mgnify:CR=1 FL=1
MVINFNLMLVWIPMCKYSLTRLTFLANGSLRYFRLKREHLIQTSPSLAMKDEAISGELTNSKLERISWKFKRTVMDAIRQLRHLVNSAKFSATKSFLIAVDHCTSLHTICATTITIASGKSRRYSGDRKEVSLDRFSNPIHALGFWPVFCPMSLLALKISRSLFSPQMSGSLTNHFPWQLV